MLTLHTIAITGEPGSGKSTVCTIFQKYGGYVVFADEIVHHLLKKEQTIKKIIDILGSTVIDNHQINHKKVADIVFTHREKLQELESVLHPLIKKQIMEHMHIAKEKHSPLFVAEIPLLFEAGWNKYFDIIVTIIADEALIKKRLENKGLSIDDYQKRKLRFLPASIKLEQSDYILDNNGSMEELESSIKNIIDKIS